jgi:hypothetical protein
VKDIVLNILAKLSLGFISGLIVYVIAYKLSFPDRDGIIFQPLEATIIIGVNLLLAVPWGWNVIVPFDTIVLLWCVWGYMSQKRTK